MSNRQIEALRNLMNAQRHYIIAATNQPELLSESLQKLWCISSILDESLALNLDTYEDVMFNQFEEKTVTSVTALMKI